MSAILVPERRQSVPRVFNLASDYHLNEHRIVGILALNAIDSFNRNSSRVHPTTVNSSTRPRSAVSLSENLWRNVFVGQIR
jgi:rapamycin-insensitive companion of mTOR